MSDLWVGDCPVCAGTTKSPRHINKPCRYCYGTGYRLTETGELVAHLIERMLDARDKALAERVERLLEDTRG